MPTVALHSFFWAGVEGEEEANPFLGTGGGVGLTTFKGLPYRPTGPKEDFLSLKEWREAKRRYQELVKRTKLEQKLEDQFVMEAFEKHWAEAGGTEKVILSFRNWFEHREAAQIRMAKLRAKKEAKKVFGGISG